MNFFIKQEFSRESSISLDSGISDFGGSSNSSIFRSGTKRRISEYDINTDKKCKIEKCDANNLLFNPFATTNFKRENNSEEKTLTVQIDPASTVKTNKHAQAQVKPKATVSSKTFKIKKCSVQIERCEGLESAKQNRSPKLLRGDRRLNKKEYHIAPAQFLSLQPKVILFQCQSYTWRSIRDDDWTFPDTEIHNSKLFSGTFNEKITFKGQIKCRNIRDGKTFYLITYIPKDVIEDEWMVKEQFVNMNFSKTLPLNELNTEAKKRLFENLSNENKPFVTCKKTTRKYTK